MRRMTIWLATAGLLVPPTGLAEGQDTPVHDYGIRNVLAVFNGGDPMLLNPYVLPEEDGIRVASHAANRILTQWTGPAIGGIVSGGRRTQTALDAFAEELVALATASPLMDGERSTEIARRIASVFRIAGSVTPDNPRRTRYEGAFNALMRIYEAGVLRSIHLYDVDPVRVVEYLLGRLPEGKLDITDACHLIGEAHRLGKIIEESEGVFRLELGGLHDADFKTQIFHELRWERFVEVHSEYYRCGHAGLGDDLPERKEKG